MDTSRCCRAAVCPQHPPVPFRTRIHTLICSACRLNLGVVYEEVVQKTEEFLSDPKISSRHHWAQVGGLRDIEIHYVLSQLIYSPISSEGEVPYDGPDPDDVVKLLWCDRMAVGFYTVKPQGPKTQLESIFDGPEMPTFDTAFILPSHRRRGFGLSMVQDFLESYPDKDLGFSHPISHAMWKVLRIFLEQHSKLRRKFWLVKGDCGEGNKTLIWLCLHQKKLQD